jgi:integrase
LFQDYAEQWLTTYVTVACKPSTGRIVRSIVRNHLLPAFGTLDLRSLTRSHVKTFVAQKQQSLSPNHVRNLVRTLHTICAQAVDEEVMGRNPASRLGKYVPEKQFNPDKVIDPFTSAELERYLTTMQTHYPQYYVYFLCLARTGMREGEGLALHWDDIQFGQGASDPYRFIHIQRTYDPVHHLFNTPKNGKSRRVDMSQELRAALLDLKNQRFDAAVLQGMTTIPPVMFCAASGRPWDPRRPYLLHKRVCAMAELRVNRVHDLRHSYATIQLYEHHAPIQYVSEQLGHASIKITVDIYGHPRQGTNTYLADRLNRGAALMQHSATQAQPGRNMVA